jgi:pimeloyl-ACP methyl ester carboxylesterase
MVTMTAKTASEYAASRCAVSFSSRIARSTDNQVGDLDTVIAQLKLGPVVLVAHDASGPPAIDWALAHPERVEGLVLLNT